MITNVKEYFSDTLANISLLFLLEICNVKFSWISLLFLLELRNLI